MSGKAKVQRGLDGQDLSVLEAVKVREVVIFECLSFRIQIAKDALTKFKQRDSIKKSEAIAKKMKATRKPDLGEWDIAHRSFLAHLGG